MNLPAPTSVRPELIDVLLHPKVPASVKWSVFQAQGWPESPLGETPWLERLLTPYEHVQPPTTAWYSDVAREREEAQETVPPGARPEYNLAHTEALIDNDWIACELVRRDARREHEWPLETVDRVVRAGWLRTFQAMADSPAGQRALAAGQWQSARHAQERSPWLTFALRLNRMTMVDALLARGYLPNTLDAQGKPPLAYAEHMRALDALLQAGANPAWQERSRSLLDVWAATDREKANRGRPKDVIRAMTLRLMEAISERQPEINTTARPDPTWVKQVCNALANGELQLLEGLKVPAEGPASLAALRRPAKNKADPAHPVLVHVALSLLRHPKASLNGLAHVVDRLPTNMLLHETYPGVPDIAWAWVVESNRLYRAKMEGRGRIPSVLPTSLDERTGRQNDQPAEGMPSWIPMLISAGAHLSRQGMFPLVPEGRATGTPSASGGSIQVWQEHLTAWVRLAHKAPERWSELEGRWSDLTQVLVSHRVPLTAWKAEWEAALPALVAAGQGAALLAELPHWAHAGNASPTHAPMRTVHRWANALEDLGVRLEPHTDGWRAWAAMDEPRVARWTAERLQEGLTETTPAHRPRLRL